MVLRGFQNRLSAPEIIVKMSAAVFRQIFDFNVNTLPSFKTQHHRHNHMLINNVQSMNPLNRERYRSERDTTCFSYHHRHHLRRNGNRDLHVLLPPPCHFQIERNHMEPVRVLSLYDYSAVIFCNFCRCLNPCVSDPLWCH